MSNKIIILWTIIIFLLLSSIFLVGKYYLENKDYILLRQEFKRNVKTYIKENDLYPEVNEEVTINSKTLIENDLIKELKYDNKECEAKAKVSKKFIFYLYDVEFKCK